MQKSFWQDVSYRPRKKLARDLNVDVAIVGGGITGVSAAYHLAKAGFSCALVEKDVIASGASGKNMGLPIEGTAFDFLEMVRALGKKYAKQWWRLTREGRDNLISLVKRESISCDLRKTGSLYVGLDKKQAAWLKKEAAERNKNGIYCKFLDKSRLKRVISSPFEAAIYVPGNYMLNPVKLVRGLAKKAERLGVKIYEKTPAVRIEPHAVHTSKGIIACGRVFVALESYNNFVKAGKEGVLAVMTKPMPNVKLGWKYGHMLWDNIPRYHAIRFSDNRLLITHYISANASRKQKDRHAAALIRTLLKYFPALKKNDVRISHQWDCKVAQSPRKIFSICSVNGIWHAFGCDGQGMSQGSLAGKIIAGHFRGKSIPEVYNPKSKISMTGNTW
jgi:gamma-glutamylputrescine oxidase